MAALLEIEDLEVYYRKAKAVEGVSLQVNEGEIVAIVGANGAGKTTIIRTIAGLKKPSAGRIAFDGHVITDLPPHERVRKGIVQVPAGRLIVAPMTVIDNLKLGAYLRKDKAGINRDLEMVFEHFPMLREKRDQLGGELSGGQQQMLAVARALMASPRLLLMDEPSIGLSPIMVAEVGKTIRDINERQGISILLVEQNCRMALKLASRAYVLELGSIALEGVSCDLMSNEQVQRSYLGG
jgi:branched-chain amino acid transport system ATP-binding protein